MPRNIYTVEIDGKQYDIEGDRPPTEQEARVAISSMTPEAPAGGALVKGMMSRGGPAVISETGQDINDKSPDSWIGGFLRSIKDQVGEAFTGAKPMLEEAAHPTTAGGLLTAIAPEMEAAGSGAKLAGQALRKGAGMLAKTGVKAAAGIGDTINPDLIATASPRLGHAVKVAQRMRDTMAPVASHTPNATGRLVGKAADPLADMLNEVRGDESLINEAVPLGDKYKVEAPARSGMVKDASGKKVYTSDVEAGRHDIPFRNQPVEEVPTVPEGRVVPRQSATLEDELLSGLSETQDELSKGPIIEARGDKSYVPPNESQIPEGGWVKDASGKWNYTSDVKSGKHDIPARGTPGEAGPEVPPDAMGEPISVNGQVIRPGDKLYDMLMGAVNKPPATPIKPMPSHGPVKSYFTPPEGPIVQRKEFTAPPREPSTVEKALSAGVRVKSWKPGMGPKPETVQEVRDLVGSQNASKPLGIPTKKVTEMSKGSGALPTMARDRIDRQLAALQTPAEREAYLNAAPNKVSRDYIRQRLAELGGGQ